MPEMPILKTVVLVAVLTGALTLTLALPAGFLATSAGAQDAALSPQPKKGAPDEKTIQALIMQLGDDSFDKREAAHNALATIGLPAFDLLRKAMADAAPG